MKNWVLELLGTMILVVAYLWTHANPYIVGLTYTAILLIAPHGSYSPLITAAQWSLGRMESTQAVQLVLAQIAGASLAVVGTPLVGLNGALVQ
jgi:glycerol uptake facilitator-like aquaporin